MSDHLKRANCWGTQDERLLLKAALLSGDAACVAWVEWCQLRGAEFDDINYVSYTLLPLVARNLAKYIPHDNLLERCKGIYRRNWVFNQLLWRKTLPVLEQFQANNIDKIVLLKGMAMIAHYYHDFGVRVMGDIDVLIAPSSVEIAVNVLIQQGWHTSIQCFDPQMLTCHAANFKLDEDTNLDLHWSPLFESIKNIDVQMLQDAEPIQLQNINVYVPNATDLLIQTCVHGVKHSPVPLIRWICDAMTILQQARDKIDWERVVTFAQQTHVCTTMKAAFTFLNEEFAADIPLAVIKALRLKPVSRLERWENWAKERNYFIAKTWTRFCLQHGYTTIWQQIYYTPRYLQQAARLRHRWQVPFYAVYWILKRTLRLLRV